MSKFEYQDQPPPPPPPPLPPTFSSLLSSFPSRINDLFDRKFLSSADVSFLLEDDVKTTLIEYIDQHHPDNGKILNFDVANLFAYWREKLPQKFHGYFLPISPGIFRNDIRTLARHQQLVRNLSGITDEQLATVKKSKAGVVLYATVLIDGVGDFVQLLAIARQLQASYPDVTITTIAGVSTRQEPDLFYAHRVSVLKRIMGSSAGSNAIYFLDICLSMNNLVSADPVLEKRIQTAELLVNVSYLDPSFRDLVKVCEKYRAQRVKTLLIGEPSSDPFVFYTGEDSNTFRLLSSQFDSLGCTSLGMVCGIIFDDYILENIDTPKSTLLEQIEDDGLRKVLLNPNCVGGSAYLRTPDRTTKYLCAMKLYAPADQYAFFIKNLPHDYNQLLKQGYGSIVIHKKSQNKDEETRYPDLLSGDGKPVLHLYHYPLSQKDCKILHLINPVPSGGGDNSHFQILSGKNIPFFEPTPYGKNFFPVMIRVLESLNLKELHEHFMYCLEPPYDIDYLYLVKNKNVLTEQWNQFREFLLKNYDSKYFVDRIFACMLDTSIYPDELKKFHRDRVFAPLINKRGLSAAMHLFFQNMKIQQYYLDSVIISKALDDLLTSSTLLKYLVCSCFKKFGLDDIKKLLRHANVDTELLVYVATEADNDATLKCFTEITIDEQVVLSIIKNPAASKETLLALSMHNHESVSRWRCARGMKDRMDQFNDSKIINKFFETCGSKCYWTLERQKTATIHDILNQANRDDPPNKDFWNGGRTETRAALDKLGVSQKDGKYTLEAVRKVIAEKISLENMAVDLSKDAALPPGKQ